MEIAKNIVIETTIQPSAEIIAEVVYTGKKGDPGEKGEKGDKGEPGERGPSVEINGISGESITLTAEDIGALPDTTFIPTSTSDLVNDSNFIQAEIVTEINEDSTHKQIPTAKAVYDSALRLVRNASGTLVFIKGA